VVALCAGVEVIDKMREGEAAKTTGMEDAPQNLG